MQIRVAQDSDRQVWDAYVRRHPRGLAYHQFAWKQAVETAYGLEARYLLAEENDQVTGVLPLILFGGALLKKRYVSLPYCDLGGPLADSPEMADRLIGEAVALARHNGVAEIELRTQGDTDGPQLASDENAKVRMVLALPAGSDQLLAGLRAKVRSQVKKPMRDGLTARTGGLELLDDFYAVFVRNMRDLGSPVHSRAWIQAIIEHYGPQARVAVVYTGEGKAAAAGILLLHPAVASNPWASALRAYKQLNPNMLLYWTMLAHAADNGYPWFDFGRSTRGSGTYRFKQQWGAVESPLLWTEAVRDQPLAGGAAPSRMRIIVESVWRRLPLGLTASLGPLVRRHIPL